jgi:phospholipase C
VRLSDHDQEGLENRKLIEHVVVLMLENRSFDHMLGYLSLPPDLGGAGRDDVLGLEPGLSNDYGGTPYEIHRLLNTALSPLDGPDHSAFGVDQQLSGGNTGFVANFAATRPDDYPADMVGLVMGYYTGHELYAHDFLASNFCVCDHWFCSTPGSTLPNRLYSLTGRAARSRNNSVPPVYSLPSILWHLDAAGIGWNWFCHDPFPSLWAIDLRYTVERFTRALSNVHFFDEFAKLQARALALRLAESAGRRLLHAIEDRLLRLIRPLADVELLRAGYAAHEWHPGETFVSLASEGTLPKVSFIDPNFVDLASGASNDDHPPSDVLLGQKLVADVVCALIDGGLWKNTLLVVTYDEHGGFYDHVTPPSDVPDIDPDPQFHRLGPRVPALLMAPTVRRTSDTVFDHTTLLKTILTVFCLDPSETMIPDMGPRVTGARHLLFLLDQKARTESALTGYEELSVQAKSAEELREAAYRPNPAPQYNDWQLDYLAAQRTVLSLVGLFP